MTDISDRYPNGLPDDPPTTTDGPQWRQVTPLQMLANLDECRLAPQARIQDLPEIGGRPQGWGDKMAGSLRGMRAGRLWVVGAAKAKAGKSMFVHMLLDGLAMLRRDDGGLEAPVFLVTENDTETIDGRLFSKLTEQSPLNLGVTSCKEVLENSGGVAALKQACEGLHVLNLDENYSTRGEALAEELARKVQAWREAPENKDARAVPVVCLDPYNRCIDLAGGDEYSATRAFVSRMKSLAVEHQFACILVSDTNKAHGASNARNIAAADADAKAGGLIKGAYEVSHQAHAVIILEPLDAYLPKDAARPREWPAHGVVATVAMARDAAGAHQVFEVDWPRATMTPCDASLDAAAGGDEQATVTAKNWAG